MTSAVREEGSGAGAAPARGRPQASSRETLADAASELFLEQGYETTSVSEITQRAGVSRSTFFNYFDGKAATIWFALDEPFAGFARSLASSALAETPGVTPMGALRALAADLGARPPHTLALAISNAEVMGIGSELETGRALRQSALARAVARADAGGGSDLGAVRAEITGAALAAAVFAGIWRWAGLGAGAHRLEELVGEALDSAAALMSMRH